MFCIVWNDLTLVINEEAATETDFRCNGGSYSTTDRQISLF
jgi:hypothetical protein